MSGTGSDDDSLGFVGALVGDHFFDRACEVQALDETVDSFNAEFLGVLRHLHGEVHAGEAGKAGIVVDLISIDDLSAVDIVLLDDDSVQSCPGGVDSGCKAGGAGSDDDQVVHKILLNTICETEHTAQAVCSLKAANHFCQSDGLG